MSVTLKRIIGIIAAVGLLALLLLILLVRLGVIEEDHFSAAETTPTPTLTPSPTPSQEPEDKNEYFTLSFVGDCTLASPRFERLSGGEAEYPFANVVDIFKADDATIANLECNFSDAALSSDSTFNFKAPVSYAKMLVAGGIEFVTTANNHTDDFGQKGLTDTFAALDGVGVSYGKENEAVLYTTESGLTIGFYCAYDSMSDTRIKEAVASLKASGAEYIVCAFHWGDEGAYRPNLAQKRFAHTAIDSGADLVYGAHPHVLQPVEEYGGGLIMYSLGNFSFGGNSAPRDCDSVIAQIKLCRDENGVISLVGYELIPCSISSVKGSNDYRPTLYAEGSDEYKRAISKLDGSFTGPDLVVDYSKLFPSPEPSVEPSPVPSPDPGGETPIPDDGVEDPIPVPDPIEPPTVTE